MPAAARGVATPAMEQHTLSLLAASQQASAAAAARTAPVAAAAATPQPAPVAPVVTAGIGAAPQRPPADNARDKAYAVHAAGSLLQYAEASAAERHAPSTARPAAVAAPEQPPASARVSAATAPAAGRPAPPAAQAAPPMATEQYGGLGSYLQQQYDSVVFAPPPAAAHSAPAAPAVAARAAPDATSAIGHRRGDTRGAETGSSGAWPPPSQPSAVAAEAHTAWRALQPAGRAPQPQTLLGNVLGCAVYLHDGQFVCLPSSPPDQPSISAMPLAEVKAEKDRLKHALQRLEDGYEAGMGVKASKDDKEVLRPFYVRYHKLKHVLKKAGL